MERPYLAPSGTGAISIESTNERIAHAKRELP